MGTWPSHARKQMVGGSALAPRVAEGSEQATHLTLSLEHARESDRWRQRRGKGLVCACLQISVRTRASVHRLHGDAHAACTATAREDAASRMDARAAAAASVG